MDFGWGFIYFMLSLITLRFAWQTTARWLALALVINCTLSNLVNTMAPLDAAPAINVTLALGMIIFASFNLCSAPTFSVAILILSTAQCMLGIAFSAQGDMNLLYLYEEKANAIFASKCVTILVIGTLNVVGPDIRNWFRWRTSRRHATDAASRLWLGSRPPR